MQDEFSVRILGKSSAIPTKNSFPSSQAVTYGSSVFLVDCGEGCQMQIRRNHISLKNLRHIFISHLHGDHYFGLFGLLSTMNLSGRRQALHLYGHPKLERILKLVFYQGGEMPAYPIVFHALNYERKSLVLETKKLSVFSFPLRHRIPTCGFLFKEKTDERNIRPEAIQTYDLSRLEIRRAKLGSDIYRDGKLLAACDELCYPKQQSRSYAYCSDTAYSSITTEYVNGVDLLYHEATFADDMLGKEEATYHSTAKQAALVAKSAGAGRLIIGHFSTRYRDESLLLEEAKSVFPESIAACENLLIELAKKQVK